MGTKDKLKKPNKNFKNNRQRREKFSVPLIPDDDKLRIGQSFGNKRNQYSTYRNNNSLNTQSRKRPSSYYFVSPIYGKLEDKATYPQTSSHGDIDKQYDFLRDKKRLNKAEFKEKHGSDFYEFSLRNKNIKTKESMSESNVEMSQPNETSRKETIPDKTSTQDKEIVNHKKKMSFEQINHEIRPKQDKMTGNNSKEDKQVKSDEHMKKSLKNLSISNQKSNDNKGLNQKHTEFNVIFEEEFELKEDGEVLTSYDESNDECDDQNFFNDFSTPHLSNHEFTLNIDDFDKTYDEQSDDILNHDEHDDANPFSFFPTDHHENHFLEDREEDTFDDALNSDDEPIYKDEFIFKVDFNDENDSDFDDGASYKNEDDLFNNVNDELNDEFTSVQGNVKKQEPQQRFTLNDDYDDEWTFDNEEEQVEVKVPRSKSSHRETKLKQKENNGQFSSSELASYQLPPTSLLAEGQKNHKNDLDWIHQKMSELDETLQSFDLDAKTVDFTQGPTVTRLEVKLAPGIKVSKITGLQDNIKLGLAVNELRIEAPIPGKNTIGIEIPNMNKQFVQIRDILETPKFKSYKSPLKVVLGLDITGEPIYSDISKMPHGLIAGSTGSGKSVCINNIIVSLLYNTKPDEVKLILIDPKMVELAPYNNIPHLLTPVITDPKTATASLKWATEEMDRRYSVFANVGARDIKSYNNKRLNADDSLEKIPYIVIIIDELADLMTVAAQDTEESILRIAQKARAAGIHLILATQRPSVNIITGNIKINIPTRIAFKVQSLVDSRTILDESGAEKLLGKGDMLLLENGMPEVMRLQGSFISDDEIDQVTSFICNQLKPKYAFTKESLVKSQAEKTIDYDDELYDEVARYLIDCGEASASRIQRRFSIGFNRAARLLDIMEQNGIVSPSPGGSKPREVLIGIDEYKKQSS